MSPQIRARHTLAESLRFIAGDALSSFEDALIVEISARRRAFGDEAVVTAAEAEILAAAIQAMDASITREVFAAREGVRAMIGRAEAQLGAAS